MKMPNEKCKRFMRSLLYGIVAIILVLPSLVITQYSYPCQDDFTYASCAQNLLSQGYNLLTMSLKMTVEYYKTFTGCYTSSFLGHFFSGLINCQIRGIRAFEFCSLIIFYISLLLLVYVIACKIMQWKKREVLPLYCLVLALFNGLIYYSDHDDFYWFITSVQYLLISSMILIGFSLAIYGCYLEDRKKRTLVITLSALLGFLGSGGTLSIAAFGCSLYVISFVWGFFVRKKKREAIIVMTTTLVGAILNGIAPGNYIRAGEPVTTGVLINAVIKSARYTLERWETFLHNPVFWIIVTAMVVFIFHCEGDSSKIRFKFMLPLVFIFVLFGFVAGIIFPTILGYGYECYIILNRGNFISDTAFYIFLLLALLYVRGWVHEKYPQIEKIYQNRDVKVCVILLIVCMLVMNRNDMLNIPVIKEYVDWSKGEYRKYSDYCMGIYQEIAQSDDDIVEIYVNKVEDMTCMMNPQFYEGYYNPDEEYANRTIADFYGKSAVYVYDIDKLE